MFNYIFDKIIDAMKLIVGLGNPGKKYESILIKMPLKA